MIQELAAALILIGSAYLLVYKLFLEKRRYMKRLIVLKDIGGHSVVPIEFKVREQELSIDPDDPGNKAWFLVTPKEKGRQYIWPRPPYENWVSDTLCILYSKSYKGNNYACRIEKKDYIAWIRKKKTNKEAFTWEYAIEDNQGSHHPAKITELKGEYVLVDATETRAVVFPPEAHKIEPIFDERNLPEMVALHTTMNQLFGWKTFMDKYGEIIRTGGVLVMVFVVLLFNYKMFQEMRDGPIDHQLTVKVENPGQIEYEKIVEPTPATPTPPEEPPEGGKFADILRNQ